MKNKKTKLVIASGKGGVGKSMLTSGLAMLFSKNRKVVAVDCDADAPNLGIWLGGIKKWDKTIPVVASARPEIDYKKCDLCEGDPQCLKFCPHDVFGMEGAPKKLIVKNPNNCVVFCRSCRKVCARDALSFPNKAEVLKIIKKKRGY